MADRKAMQGEMWRMPFRVIGWYFAVSALWIALSDEVLAVLVSDPVQLTRIGIVKGWFFLLATSCLMFLLIRRGLGIISRNSDLLASSESRYRALFEEMQDGFALHEIICSPDGKPIDYLFLECNPALERLTGLKAEQVVGKKVSEILPGIEPFWIETFGKVALTGEPVHFTGYQRDLGKYFEVSGFSPEPGRFAVLCSDVSQQRQVEMELGKLTVALEERVEQRTAQYVEANQKLKEEIAQRMRAEEEVSSLNRNLLRQKAELVAANRELEAFSFSVSHDLRAPVRHIGAFVQMLEDDWGGRMDDSGREYLHRIERCCGTMDNLIDELLKLARVGRSEMHLSRLNLSRTAREVAQELQQAEPGRKVLFHIADRVEGMGDHALMRIVLRNLMGNAYKYTGRKSEAHIWFGEELQGGRRIYFVRDNGAGFDMRYAGKLFGAFQRLHGNDEFEGSGVGLAIVQRIVHRHGGEIWGKGEPERGATFCFTLTGPRCDSDSGI